MRSYKKLQEIPLAPIPIITKWNTITKDAELQKALKNLYVVTLRSHKAQRETHSNIEINANHD